MGGGMRGGREDEEGERKEEGMGEMNVKMREKARIFCNLTRGAAAVDCSRERVGGECISAFYRVRGVVEWGRCFRKGIR
jgi:hypothetical protein